MSRKLRGQLLAATTLALGAAFTLMPSQAFAQATGATDVDINLPNIVVLHYFSNVDITIDAATLEAYLDFTGGDAVDEGTASGSDLTSDLDIEGTPLTDPTGDPAAVELVLQNAWAVRALGGSGSSIQIAITNTDGTLAHTLGDTISIDTVEVQESGGTWAATRTFAPTGLVTPKVGDVRLTMDLSSATRSGDYLDGTYTLTVSNL